MTPPTPPPTHAQRLASTALWIFGGLAFVAMLLLAAYMGLTLSDEGWKSLVAIALASIAAGVPIMVSHMKAQGAKLDKVEKHTNSIVEKLVDQAREKGEDTGRRKEVARAEQEAEGKEVASETTTTLKVPEGSEVLLEGTLTVKDEEEHEDTEKA